MGYRVVSLGDVIQLEDSKRQPLSSRERDNRRGVYPYYGAQGIVDYLDDYTYEGDYLLVAEDGENLRSRKQPIANAAHGRFRVNNHAHVIAATKCCNLIYLRHLLNNMDIAAYVTGSTQPKLSQTSLLNMKVELPEIDKQDAIATFLHCFDAKITANAKLNGYLEELADSLFKRRFGELPDNAFCRMWRTSPWGNHLPAARITKMVLGRCSTRGARSSDGVIHPKDLAQPNQNAWQGAAMCL